MRHALIISLLLAGPSAARAELLDFNPAPVFSTATVNNLLDTAAKDPSASARLAAENSLLRLGHDAVPKLSAHLQDHSDPIRAEAVEILGRLGDSSAVPALAKSAREDSQRVVRERAVKALSQIPGDDTLPVFLSVLKEEKDGVVRAAAVDALGRSHDAQAVNALIQTLGDPDTQLSSAAAEALAGLRPAPTDELSRALKDSRPGVRARAAEALGGTGDGNAAPPLIKTLSDKDVSVRLSAVQALGNLREDRAIPHLQKLLHSEKNAQVRQAAQAALAAMGR